MSDLAAGVQYWRDHSHYVGDGCSKQPPHGVRLKVWGLVHSDRTVAVVVFRDGEIVRKLDHLNPLDWIEGVHAEGLRPIREAWVSYGDGVSLYFDDGAWR